MGKSWSDSRLDKKGGKGKSGNGWQNGDGLCESHPDRGVVGRDTDEKPWVWHHGQPPAQFASAFSEVLPHA